MVLAFLCCIVRDSSLAQNNPSRSEREGTYGAPPGSSRKSKDEKDKYLPDLSDKNGCLYFNPSQLLLGEIQGGYEFFPLKKYPQRGFAIEGGYKFWSRSETFSGLATNFFADLFGYAWSNSVYASFSTTKYYLKYERDIPRFFETTLFYRRNYFNSKWVRFSHGQGDYDTPDERQTSVSEIFGLKFLFGKKSILFNIRPYRVMSVFKLGFSLRAKFVTKTTDAGRDMYNGAGHQYPVNPPRREELSYLLPAFHIGVRIGLDRMIEAKE